AIAFVLGFKDGFVRKLIGTAGFILAVYFGIKFSTYGGKLLHNIANIEPELAHVMGGFVIFLLVIVIASILKRIIHPFDKVNNMINRIVGGIVGVLQILVFLSGIFYILGRFDVPAQPVREGSLFYSPVNKTLPALIGAIRGVRPIVQSPINTIMKDTLK
ncbi:MAG: CvpA family protein, partial [Ignavibacteriales bacterium]|nr:CvpA family protein [Ignavibacteriales bacterium]